MKSEPSSSSFASLMRASRRISAMVFIAIVGLQSASAGIKSERLLATILKHTPEATLVTEGEQMAMAEDMAASLPGAQTFWGVGTSMEPLYAPRTAIVVQPIEYSRLRTGMTVVYINRHGQKIAHSLTGDLPGGWIAQGIRNDREDSDLVTRDNLIGVIVQAFAAEQTDFRVELTRVLVAKGRLNVAANRS